MNTKEAIASTRRDRVLQFVGWLAVLCSCLSLAAGIFLGWWVKGIAAIPVSAVQEAGGYVLFFGVPLSIVAALLLATIAGIRGGTGRRLGLIAGVLVVLSAPAFALVANIVPLRN
ncbi:hypothetical protein SOM11_07995 [Frigoribacterium sp. CFBP9039]|uniref:hypothetical protein n=1 Tax=Frigoribacterium TaxID=96492 RepID=UPI00177C54D9|nr:MULTISPECIES: hypothetical protein [Frigoribacterium]MBD8704927.1 hypothetical protein [Frigoribacterium sp. CFBP 13712]MCJ0700995.1 hypothetical protein [Frigoribacterium faeni]MDY0891499.1 hypothetical protein [Frigoribacterium sp. CFBP9030]MDY0945922.1 hypothetical protein [Frigoribacterium sp. CFBP9039]